MPDPKQEPKAAGSPGPRVDEKAQAHPLADPDSDRGFTEAVTDPTVQGSTELPKTPEDLEQRAVEGVPSVQEGAPEQLRRDPVAKDTGGAGEPYFGHGDNQPGGQEDPAKRKAGK